MKLRKIINAIPSLQKLYSAELPLVIAYSVDKLIKTLNNEVKFYNEKSQAIYEKYKESQDGDRIKIKKDCVAIVNKEIEELLDLNVSVKYKKPKISDSVDIKFSAQDLEALEGFVTFIIEDDDSKEEYDENEPEAEDISSKNPKPKIKGKTKEGK